MTAFATRSTVATQPSLSTSFATSSMPAPLPASAPPALSGISSSASQSAMSVPGGRTVTVSTSAQLSAAARVAKAGDTILLAAGNFGDTVLSHVNPTGVITIKSADPNNDAVFRSLRLTRVSNIVFEDFDVARPIAAGGNTNDAAIQVNGGTNITFSGIDVRGSMNGSAFDDGHGISIPSGSHISILDSTFTQLRTAVIVRGQDFLFAGNTITQVREGVSISSMTRGVFEQNYFGDFQANYAAKEHPDMFQVHSGGTATASSELIFRDNVMRPGAGPVGGIFIASEGLARGERHENILIENNFYEGAYRHAISVSNVDDVTVRNNTVRMGDFKGLVPAIMFADIKGGVVENNISTLMLEHRLHKSSGLTYANNVDLWDPKFKKGVLASEIFANPGDGDIDFSNLNTIAGSAAGRAGAGFAAVAEIGNLSGSAAAQMAAWLQTYDQNFAVFG